MREPKPAIAKRHIVLAVALGALGAGGAAIMLEEMRDNDPHHEMQNVGPGDATETYALDGFDQISVVGSQDVIVTRGEEFSVEAEGSADALGRLEAVVENGRLLIRPRENRFFGEWGALDDVTYRITMPLVERITIDGSGEVTLDTVTGESFEGEVSGPGSLVIKQIAVDRADFSVSGSGDLEVGGTARDVRITIGGSGEIKADRLAATQASILIAGSGDVDLNVAEEAAVSITGSGDVEISGTGVCSVTRMGSGEVSCEGGGDDEG